MIALPEDLRLDDSCDTAIESELKRGRRVEAIAGGVFLVASLMVWAVLVSPGNPPSWLRNAYLLLAAGNTIATLAVRLPLQSVLGAAISVFAVTLVIEATLAFMAAPLNLAAWVGSWNLSIPLLGVVVTLTAREAARRAVLARSGGGRPRGWWLFGIAWVLSVLFLPQLTLERLYSVRYNSLAQQWTFCAWLLTPALALFAATPWLVDKRQSSLEPTRPVGLLSANLALCWVVTFVFLLQ